ncbi:hypothetical protein D3C83_137710 [compost metagenome]
MACSVSMMLPMSMLRTGTPSWSPRYPATPSKPSGNGVTTTFVMPGCMKWLS